MASVKSRLFKDSSIIEALTEVYKNTSSQENATFALYLRFVNDICTVSIDTSGEHLHFRSNDKKNTEAPLRETLAAWMLRHFIKNSTLPELQNIALIDPMAGSGTIGLEAERLLQPQFNRDYAFLKFAQKPKIFNTDLYQKNYLQFSQLFEKIYLGDKSDEALKILKQNIKNNSHFVVYQDDVMKRSKPELAKSSQAWVLTNPPYGVRIDVEWDWSDLIESLVAKYQPQRLGLLVPETAIAKLPKQLKSFRTREVIKTKNGGLVVAFVFYL